MQQRPVSAVPIQIAYAVLVGLVLQVIVHLGTPKPEARAVDLPQVPAARTLRLASLDERIGLAKFLMLYVQAFDNQPGVNVPFEDLDYSRVEGWLARILELDPRGQYPLLCASRLYAEVPDEAKQRQMLEFVYKAFLEDPDRRWPWLAHAVIIAKHRLKDLPLAARYAQALRTQATAATVPNWVRQMEIFLREDMNELETAKVLLGGLVANGQVTDPHELQFLTNKLRELEASAAKPSP